MSEETRIEASTIPEIYYDLIARVVPGALILVAYGWKDIDKGFNAGMLTVGLIFSYILGLVLSLGAALLWDCTYLKWRSKFWQNARERKTDGDLWLWIRSLRLVDRNLYTKMMAEKTLFCSLSVGSLLMCFAPPPECVVHIGRWYSAGLLASCSVIFSMCMFRVNTFLSWNMRECKKQA